MNWYRTVGAVYDRPRCRKQGLPAVIDRRYSKPLVPIQPRRGGTTHVMLTIIPIHHVKEIQPGMNLHECLRDGIKASGLALGDGDILAVTQKIISKAEGRIVKLDTVQPSDTSRSLAEQVRKDPRLSAGLVKRWLMTAGNK